MNGNLSIDFIDLGTRYAAAWSSQNPNSLVAFYTENGALSVNEGAPAVGRSAVAQTVQAFMTAFPDMLVKMTRMERIGEQTIFHWLWTGTNTGPGGTGQFVRIVGYEVWTLDATGLITESKGHYDDAEYQRQLKVGALK